MISEAPAARKSAAKPRKDAFFPPKPPSERLVNRQIKLYIVFSIFQLDKHIPSCYNITVALNRERCPSGLWSRS